MTFSSGVQESTFIFVCVCVLELLAILYLRLARGSLDRNYPQAFNTNPNGDPEETMALFLFRRFISGILSVRIMVQSS